MAEQIADLGARLPAPDSRLPLFFLADFLDDRIDLLAERIDRNDLISYCPALLSYLLSALGKAIRSRSPRNQSHPSRRPRR